MIEEITQDQEKMGKWLGRSAFRRRGPCTELVVGFCCYLLIMESHSGPAGLDPWSIRTWDTGYRSDGLVGFRSGTYLDGGGIAPPTYGRLEGITKCVTVIAPDSISLSCEEGPAGAPPCICFLNNDANVGYVLRRGCVF